MKKILFAILALLVMAGSAQAAFIDGFDSPSEGWRIEHGWYFDNTVNTLTKSESSLSNVLGGTRDISFSSHPGLYQGSYYAGDMSLALNPMVLNYGGYQNESGVLSMSTAWPGWGSVSITYDAGGNGLNADFSAATEISMMMKPDHTGNVKPSVFSITLSDGVNTKTASKSWDTYTVYAAPFVQSFSLTEFSGIDLTNIFSVSWEYQGDESNDISFASLTTDAPPVPVPAAVWLLGSGLVGLIGLRKKFRG